MVTKKAPPPPAAEAAPAPSPPPTLEQEPAIQPQVVFANGQLTITAPNSTLGEILRAVRNRTGASVDVPGNATERVVGQFGPGPARDVLASLLNGTHFNYVLLGSASDANALERVVLISKSGGAENPEVNQASAAQPNNVQPAPMPAGEVPHEPTMTDDEDPGTQDQEPEQQDADQGNQDETPQQPNPLAPPPGVKTPEQLLQELQRQQQQQQQGAPQGFPVPPGGQPQQ